MNKTRPPDSQSAMSPTVGGQAATASLEAEVDAVEGKGGIYLPRSTAGDVPDCWGAGGERIP